MLGSRQGGRARRIQWLREKEIEELEREKSKVDQLAWVRVVKRHAGRGRGSEAGRKETRKE